MRYFYFVIDYSYKYKDIYGNQTFKVMFQGNHFPSLSELDKDLNKNPDFKYLTEPIIKFMFEFKNKEDYYSFNEGFNIKQK